MPGSLAPLPLDSKCSCCPLADHVFSQPFLLPVLSPCAQRRCCGLQHPPAQACPVPQRRTTAAAALARRRVARAAFLSCRWTLRSACWAWRPGSWSGSRAATPRQAGGQSRPAHTRMAGAMLLLAWQRPASAESAAVASHAGPGSAGPNSTPLHGRPSCWPQVLLAWGGRTLLCCFRGTDSLKNALDDMKVRART